jgi:Mg2+ and Co2+ transporter CorA
MDPVMLYRVSDGAQYLVDTPAEKVTLLSAGYSETPPAPEDVVPVVDVQHPENHSVQDVEKFLSVHPELTETVVEAEKKGKNRATIVGSGS